VEKTVSVTKKKLKKLKSKKVKKPTREETKIFMTFMDQDGDGVVNEKEFISYMCVGMCMTKKRRKKFKKKSQMHKKLVKFLVAVGTKLEEDVDEAERSKNAMDPETLSLILSYGAG
jgi:Ca2+-binding EF-hand superfamily protein